LTTAQIGHGKSINTRSTNSDDRQHRTILDAATNAVGHQADDEGTQPEMEDGEISQSELPDDIIVELTRQNIEPSGPRVNQSIKALVESLYIRDFASKSSSVEESVISRITKKFQDVPVPINLVDIVKPAELNEAVATAAFRESRTKRLHHEALMAEKCMVKITASHVQTIESLLKLKEEMKGSDTAKQLVNETIKKAALTMEFMGLERHNIRQLRRETIVSSLNPQFKSLAEGSSVDHKSNQLFGNEVAKRVSDIEQTNKLAKRLTNKPYDRQSNHANKGKSFLGQRPKSGRPPNRQHQYNKDQKRREERPAQHHNQK
jgi:hypothetical protein